jgi:hypothetical protein
VRILIVAAVAALTAIVMTYVLKQVDGPWAQDSSIRQATIGAISAVVGMSVARNLRKKD